MSRTNLDRPCGKDAFVPAVSSRRLHSSRDDHPGPENDRGLLLRGLRPYLEQRRWTKTTEDEVAQLTGFPW